MRSARTGVIAALLSAAFATLAAVSAGAQEPTNPPVSEFWLDTQNSAPGEIFWANGHLYVSDGIDRKSYPYGLDGVRNPAADLVFRWSPTQGQTSAVTPIYVAVGAGRLYVGTYRGLLAYTLDGERLPSDDVELAQGAALSSSDAVIVGDRLYLLSFVGPRRVVLTYDLEGRPIDPAGFTVRGMGTFTYSQSKNLLYGLALTYSGAFERTLVPLAPAYTLSGEPVPSANVRIDMDWRGAFEAAVPQTPHSTAVGGVLYFAAPGHSKVYGFDLSGPGGTECTINLGRVGGTLTVPGTWERACQRSESSYYRDYRFDLPGDGRVTIEMFAGLGASTALLDAEGGLIARGSGREYAYISRDLEAGSYWFQTEPYRGYLATGPFELTITAPEIPLSTTFTDTQLVPGETPVRAVHFTELRERIDGLRSRAGLARFAWTDPALVVGVTPVRLAHLLELREGLNEAAVAAGRQPFIWTDSGLEVGAAIEAGHLEELRSAVLARIREVTR